MRTRQCGKVWLEKDMPGSSHSVTSWLRVPEEGQSQNIALRTTEGSSANRNIARVLKNRASGLELPAPKQWIWDLTPLLPCVLLTAARTGRMNGKRDQTSVFQD